MTRDPLLQQSVGSYRIVDLIGAGGMGRVYRAEHPVIGARVAIKVMALEGPALRPERIERFLAEARAVNLIRHENIVNVLDLGRLDDDTPFIVMEHLDGTSLGQRLRADGPLAPELVVTVALKVLAALAAAHAAGIVHRDLKPDNVFLTAGGQVKVLDFGLAKLLPDAELSMNVATHSSSLLGTPPYLAPEQLLGGAIDGRTDLWALGITMYELLCGRRPFESRQLFDLFEQITRAAPEAPRTLRPELSPALEAVVLRALAKEPAQRFASAAAMAGALQEQATTATTPGPSGRGVKTAEATAPTVAESMAQVTPRARRREPEAGGRGVAAARGRETEARGREPEARGREPEARGRRRGWLAGLLLLLVVAGVATALWWPRRGARDPAGGAAVAGGADAGAGAAVGDGLAADAGVLRAVAGDAGGALVALRTRPGHPRLTPTPTPTPTPTATPASPQSPIPSSTSSPSPSSTPAPSPPAPSSPAAGPDEEVLRTSISLPTLPPPHRFDVTARLTEVRAIARRYFADAVLSGIYTWTDRNGLTSLDNRGVDYTFYSAAHAGRADHLCWLVLAISDKAITVSSNAKAPCARPAGPPRCSASRVRARGFDSGVKEDPATLIYRNGQWRVEHGSSTSGVIPDDC